MNLIRSLMGRRQFLIAATATSTSAPAFKKLAGVVDPVFKTGVAMASDSPGTAGIKGAANRYSHLLSPLKIGDVVLKNRIMYTRSNPHYLQGPETFPSDVVRSYYANLARSAAIVTCRIEGGGLPRKDHIGDSAHGAIFDMEDAAVQNYIDQLLEGIHCYGSLASIALGGATVAGSSVEISQKLIEDVVTQAKLLGNRGVDMVHMGSPRLTR